MINTFKSNSKEVTGTKTKNRRNSCVLCGRNVVVRNQSDLQVDKKTALLNTTFLTKNTCPLLLRVFCSNDRHHALMEFSRGSTPTNELQIYTWMDATLKELTSLVKEVNPDARRKGTFFDFAIVYPDSRSPTFRMREIGTTCAGRKSPDDTVTLAQKKFTIGDYLDIAICPPRPGGMPPMGRGRRQF